LGWWVSGGVKSLPNQGVRNTPYVIIEVSIESSVDVLPSHLLGFFFWRITMKQLTTYINAVSAHLNKEAELGQALAKAEPVIMAMKPEARTVWFHTNIAPLVAQAYKVELVLTRNGTTSFNDKKSGKRHDTALSKFRYVTQIQLLPTSSTTVSKKVDKIDQARRKAEKFANAHKVVEIRAEIAVAEAYIKSLKAYV
jgi:hypothetical protein